jgi:cytochrome P450
MEGQIILASLLARYRLELAQAEPEMETQVSLHPKGGLKVTVVRR